MSEGRTSGGGGIDLSTLVITAVASAAAAYTCSKIWAPGTLASAAFTPVIVALLKEALAKPTEVVVRAVPVRGVVRSSTGPDGIAEEAAAVRSGGSAPDPDEGLDTSERLQRIEQIGDRVAQPGELQGSTGAADARRRRAWQMAVITGLLGFVLAAAIITLPELVAGKSAFGGDRGTTLLGGKAKHSKSSTTTTTDTTTTETSTEGETTPTLTVPPAETVTVPPAETTTVPPETEVAPETTPQDPALTTTEPSADPSVVPPAPPG